MKLGLISLAFVAACGGLAGPAPSLAPPDAAADAAPAGPCCVFEDGTGEVCCGGDAGTVAFFYDNAGREFGCGAAGEVCAPAYACSGIVDGHAHLGACR